MCCVFLYCISLNSYACFSVCMYMHIHALLNYCSLLRHRNRTGQLLGNHVAVETDWNVRRFDHESLRQLQCIVTDEDLHVRNVLHFNLFLLLRDCSTIAQSYSIIAYSWKIWRVQNMIDLSNKGYDRFSNWYRFLWKTFHGFMSISLLDGGFNLVWCIAAFVVTKCIKAFMVWQREKRTESNTKETIIIEYVPSKNQLPVQWLNRCKGGAITGGSLRATFASSSGTRAHPSVSSPGLFPLCESAVL